MFARLARGEPPFRAWLEQEFAKQTDVLVRSTDEAELRRAQGRAQMLQTLVANMDKCVELSNG
jgi:hypothetical protein